MSIQEVWFIGVVADPARAHDKVFYPSRAVAEHHCRNLKANTGPAWEVHEAVVVPKAEHEAARAPGPDVAKLLAAATGAKDFLRDLSEDGDLEVRRGKRVLHELEDAIAEHEAARSS